MLHLILVSITLCLISCKEVGETSTPATPDSSPTSVLAAAGCTAAQSGQDVTLTCNGASATIHAGTQGVTGASGPQGPGGYLVVTDANGVKYTDLVYVSAGVFLNTTTGSLVSYQVLPFVYNSSDPSGYSTMPSGPVAPGVLYFTSNNCTGTAYVSTGALLNGLIFASYSPAGTPAYYKVSSFVSSQLTMNSEVAPFGVCGTPAGLSVYTRYAAATPTTLKSGDYSSIPGPVSLSTQ